MDELKLGGSQWLQLDSLPGMSRDRNEISRSHNATAARPRPINEEGRKDSRVALGGGELWAHPACARAWSCCLWLMVAVLTVYKLAVVNLTS